MKTIQNVMASLTPLIKKTEVSSWENRPFTTVWPENETKLKDITKTIKKKSKRIRTSFTTEQLRALERTFTHQKYIDSERREELAKTLNIGEKCIKIWFQNRRMKEKKEPSESSGDTSSESFETAISLVSPPLSEPIDRQTHQNELPNPLSPCNQFAHVNDNFCHYQLPYNYNPNDISRNTYEGMQTTNFYNDNNVYPTQYYPNGNCYYSNDYNNTNYNNGYDQYGNEVNNAWTSNSDIYYYTV